MARITCPADITLDTTVGEMQEALESGAVTMDDWKAQQPRIQAEKAAREDGLVRSIEAAKAWEIRSRPRKGRWTSRFIVGGNGWRGYLVVCYHTAWHVDEGTFNVKRIR